MYIFFKYLLFFLLNYFLEQFQVRSNIEHMPPRRFLTYPCPTRAQPPPSPAPPADGTCGAADEPAVTIITQSPWYLRVHSWCCTVCKFGQMCDDTYPPLQCHAEYFHCPKNLCFAYSSLPPPSPRQSPIFSLAP